MKSGRHVILVIGVIMVVLLLFFPSWSAYNPNDPNSSQPLGFAWAFSPPTGPAGFDMVVKRDGFSFQLALSVAALAVYFWWLVGRRGSE